MAIQVPKNNAGISEYRTPLTSLLPYEPESYPLSDTVFSEQMKMRLGFDPSKLKRFRFTPERLFELSMLSSGILMKDKARFHSVLSAAKVHVPQVDFLQEGYVIEATPFSDLRGLKLGEHLDGLTSNLEVRAGMLENGGKIVIKPRAGSRAIGIAFLSLSENRENLVVRSSDPKLHEKIHDVMKQEFGASEADLRQDAEKGISLMRIREGRVKGTLAMFEWIAYPMYYAGNERLAGRTGDRVWTLAERQVEEPCYAFGRRWEARHIVQDVGGGHEVTGSYAKLGPPGKIIANISEGGRIYDLHTVISRLYRRLRLKSGGEEITMLTKEFMEECREQSVIAAQAMEKDLRELQVRYKPDYPLPVRMSHMSVDFMGERYIDENGGVRMRPVVIDINNMPYYTGLLEWNPEATLRIDNNLRIIHKETINGLTKLSGEH